MNWKEIVGGVGGKFSPKLRSDIPYLIFLMVFLNLFFCSMIQTMVFSFLPKLVKSFNVAEVDVGRYAGIIASAIYIGSMFSSIPWGYFTDRCSKRNAIVLCGTGTLLTTVAFGFSVDVSWASVTRSLQGVAAGQLVVLKALLGDVCDQHTMAYGSAVVECAFSVGSMIGPSVGGWTAFSAELYPDIFSIQSVVGQFPALLPNIIVAVGLGVGVVVTLVFFPKPAIKNEEKTPLLDIGNKSKYGATILSSKLQANISDEFAKSNSSPLVVLLKSSAMFRLLQTNECWFCCILFCLFSITDAGFNEMFPVLAATVPEYKGLGFTPEQLGTVLLVISLACIVLQLTVLPQLAIYFGPQRYLLIVNLIRTFVIPLLPSISAVHNPTLIWLSLVLVLFVDRACVFAGCVSINMLIANSSHPDLRGSANGVTMTAANMGRLMAPLICGSIYSWSLTNVVGIDGNESPSGFPFNQYCTFYFLSALSVLVAVITAWLPKSMNSRRVIDHGSSERLT